MTVLFFSRLFYPHIGGVEKHVLEIGKRMVKDGHTVNVVTENDGWSEMEKVEGITVYRMAVGQDDKMKKIRIWRWIERHKKLIADADIIHCHDVFFWYFPFRFFYIHKPVYITFHGYETVFPPAKKAIVIRKFSEIMSSGNICIGDYIKKWYGTHPTYVTYGGITPFVILSSQAKDLIVGNINNHKVKRKFKSSAKFNNEILRLKTQNDKSNSILRIVFLGRLEKDTGITVYLKVLEELRNKKVDFTFDAYGDGSLRKITEEYGKVHGFQENVSDILETADIIFSSSYLSMLESFAKKKLVFSVFENQLKKDYLEMTPFAEWLCITDNSIILANAIIDYLHTRSSFQESIDAAYDWAKEQTWEKVRDIYYKLWNINY